MKRLVFVFLVAAMAGVAIAQQAPPPTNPMPGVSPQDLMNQPIERLGPDDLIGIAVYDSPELTRTVRVEQDGSIRLPMVKVRIHAAGLYPSELEVTIADELLKEKILVDPIVVVSVAEYRSRPITVAGEVKFPTTFQATGVITLLDALSKAGGLTEQAGEEVLLSRQDPDNPSGGQNLVQRFSLHALMSGEDPSLNIRLEGGEQVRVPPAGHIFVLGDVKRAGSFQITDGAQSSVLKALALSEGLDSFPAKVAYIYRADSPSGTRHEVRIELRKIMDRKLPDVAMAQNDILYVPTAGGVKAGLKVLSEGLGLGAGLGAATIYAYH